jgi:ADP-ribosyl-[dinitrogen reductase] hydrolase
MDFADCCRLIDHKKIMSTPATIPPRDRILGGLWGSLVGDALGVPVEFTDRATLLRDPVTSMREYGTHHQPRGTWSDDGAMTLCTVDSLVNHEFSLQDMGDRFVRWMNDGLWTATGDVFDIGGTTSSALLRITRGTPAEQAGGQHEDNNGNGSLMRIMPVVLRFADDPIKDFARRVESVSAITHGHARSRMACVFFGLVVRQVLSGQTAQAAISLARNEFAALYSQSPELPRFRYIMEDNFANLPEGEILSTGYTLHTLHASLWCLLTTQSFRDCVLKAVNLGFDTDTTGCVAGGLAGAAYGFKSIPSDWIKQLARRGDLDCLFHEFADLCEQTGSKSSSASS